MPKRKTRPGLVPHPAMWLMFALCLLSAASCVRDAPHSNPLDPQNPDYISRVTLQGVVTGAYPPYPAIPEAHVTLPDLQLIAVTNLEGRFSFPEVPLGEYTLYAAKSGYRADSQRVRIEAGITPAPIAFRLDALPRVEALELTTIHISRWWPPDDLYLLNAVAMVWDPDGPYDLKAVWLECDGWGKIDTLVYDPSRRAYVAETFPEEIPGHSLAALQGHPFWIRAEDQAGASNSGSPLYISRIIHETPVVQEPKGYVDVSPQPTLRWSPLDLDFPYTWEVEIVRLEGGLQTPVWRRSNVPADTLSLVPNQPLSPGSYYWVVWIVDEWKNRSRSKEGAFRVP